MTWQREWFDTYLVAYFTLVDMAILNFIYLERVNVCLFWEIKKATSPLPFEILNT